MFLGEIWKWTEKVRVWYLKNLSVNSSYTLKNKGYLLALMVAWRKYTESVHCTKGSLYCVLDCKKKNIILLTVYSKVLGRTLKTPFSNLFFFKEYVIKKFFQLHSSIHRTFTLHKMFVLVGGKIILRTCQRRVLWGSNPLIELYFSMRILQWLARLKQGHSGVVHMAGITMFHYKPKMVLLLHHYTIKSPL